MIKFTVEGTPVAQPRPRVGTRHGKPAVYRDDRHPVHAFKDAVHLASAGAVLQLMAHGGMLLGPVAAVLEFVMPRPKSLKKGGRVPHGVKPDGDNLAKAVLDALNDRVFKDDGQVADLTVRKWYAASDEKPHTVVRICPLDGRPDELDPGAKLCA